MSKITPVYLDFESFWSTEHTLSKMSPTEYVMHPLTEIQSISIGIGDGAIGVLFGEKEIRAMLAKIDWSNAMAIGHNMSGFDALILRWRFGINPKMWGCTAAMARSAHSKTQVMLGGKPLVGVSLKKLAAEFGVGAKLDFEATNTKGKRLEDFTREEMQAMREYNRVDTELCRKLFKKLIKGFPKQELLLIDMTTRMLVDPQFELDMPMLEVALSMERDAKHKALLALAKDIRKISGVDAELDWHDEEAVAEFVRSEMASAARFGALLQRLGVPVPMKQSKTDPDKDIPALAKTDEEFIKLQEHPDPVVAAAARTRLQVKSTLLETRLEAFMRMGKSVGGMMPMPLKYAGADTTGRWSGEHVNPQNLPRINPKSPKPSDALRNSLRAPKGMKVIVSDLSGIELRVNMFLWKVQYAMDLFKADPEKADLYKYFAANNLFHVPESEITKDQRQVGKLSHLGLGFGSAEATFQKIARLMGGIDMPLYPTEGMGISAAETVDVYRRGHPEVVKGWKSFHASLPNIMQGIESSIDPWGMCITEKHAVRLPSGRRIHYPGLRREVGANGKSEWWYGHGRTRARIYAGKGVENCIAEGTPVLCGRGWVPIEQVTTEDLVHDGVEFVQHAGTVFKSVQPCITLDGVYMTPDHEVLTDDGWTQASQVQRPYRPDIRHVDSAQPRTFYGQDVAVEIPVPVRSPDGEAGGRRDSGAQAGGHAKLWVQHRGSDIRSAKTSRHEQASGVRSLAVHAGPLQAAIAQSMEKLRRSWDCGVRSLARVVRELLGGHGACIPAWAGSGPTGQRWALFAGELPLGAAQGQHHEQAHHNPIRGCGGAQQADGYWADDAVQPAAGRLAAGAAHQGAFTRKPVYDIVNCGPRHRFVIQGASGPMVVHNCVQALARDVIAEHMVKFYQATGLTPALTVHDEIVMVVPEGEAEDLLATLQGIMRAGVSWWPELVTWSEGDIADTYGAAK